jgi:outer membrane receptor protein involved in Fe transport
MAALIAANNAAQDILNNNLLVDPSGNTIFFAVDGSGNMTFDPSGNALLDPSGNSFPDLSDDSPLQTSIGFARRTTELRQRSSSNERQTLRISVGMRGDFGDTWTWDTSFTYGQTQQSRLGTGQVNVNNFRQALDVLVDGSGNPILDVDGNIRCADDDAVAFGCVPVNIFGKGAISQDAANWLQADASFRAIIEQQVFAANLTGEIFDLPAGAVSIATGIEHRRESSTSIPDSLGQVGLNASNAIPRTSGQFNVSEWYFEGDIPLLNDSGLGDFAAIGGAVRIADYSTVGTVISWNVRGEWQPIPDIRFRVNYGQSVRAPNISELFTAPSQTFPPGLSDPCAGVTASSTGTLPVITTGNLGGGGLAVNCLADPGILAAVTPSGSFNPAFQNLQGISGFNSGNPNLSEEKADTLTISAILTPQFVPGLSITIDYYDIDISQAIQGIPRQNIIDSCYKQAAPANASFCAFITRFAPGVPQPIPGQGNLKFVNSAQLNVGTFRTTGIDATLDYTTPMDSIFPGADGTLSVNVIYSYLIKLDQQTVLASGTTTNNFAGTVYSSKHRANAQLTYDNGPLTINYSIRLIGAADVFEGGQNPADPFDDLDMETYHDIQVRYRFGNAEVYAGMQNIFNNFAKIIPGRGSVTGCNSFCDLYDPFGRTIQAGVVLTY